MSFFNFFKKNNSFTTLHIPNTITSSGGSFDSTTRIVSYFSPDDKDLNHSNKPLTEESCSNMKDLLGSFILIGCGVLFGFVASFILDTQEKKNQKK